MLLLKSQIGDGLMRVNVIEKRPVVSEGRKDFREKLFSIFVDNLNPLVDLVCLWRAFKPFGRVRDVFLSPANSSRRCRYAFVRFDSKEEASYVAKMTDRMLIIYGWKISSKVALYGWSSRRVARTRKSELRKSDVVGRAGVQGIKRQQVRYQGGLSFAEVLQGNERSEDERKERLGVNVETMVCEGKKFKEEWMSKCAVGVFYEFTSVHKVSQRLRYQDFTFSTIYLGGISILWSFESENDCERFIKDRFFWEDSFKSMVKGEASFVPQDRLTWINIFGTPLGYWCNSLFKNVGNYMGETMLIEEDTLFRKRMDRGRLLVMIPFGRSCPSEIKVVDGNITFNVKVTEDVVPVDHSWLVQCLGLKWEVSQQNLKVFSGKEKSEGGSRMRDGACSPFVTINGDRDLGNQGSSRLLLDVDNKDNRCVENRACQISENSNKSLCSGGREKLDLMEDSGSVREGVVSGHGKHVHFVVNNSYEVLRKIPTYGSHLGYSKPVLISPKEASPDQQVLAAASEEDDQGNGNGEERSPLPKNSDLESHQGAEGEEVIADLKKTTWNSDVGDVGGVGNDRSMMRIERKKIHSVKSHGMKTRHSNARALDLNIDFGEENIAPEVKKAPLNLIAKVPRLTLGLDVKGKEKDMVEENVRRIKADIFGKLEGIPPCNNNQIFVFGNLTYSNNMMDNGVQKRRCNELVNNQDFNKNNNSSINGIKKFGNSNRNSNNHIGENSNNHIGDVDQNSNVNTRAAKNSNIGSNNSNNKYA